MGEIVNMNNTDRLQKHCRRIEEYAPKTGAVRLLRLTEKQYNNIYMVACELNDAPKTVHRSTKTKMMFKNRYQ